MVILHPDGTYEVCALPTFAARWLRAFVRRRSDEPCLDGDGRAAQEAGCREPCQESQGDPCASP